MKKIAVIAIAGALALSGCSAWDSYGSSSDETQNGEVHTITVQYNHKPLTCVQMVPNTNAQTLSCDFIKYYNSDNQYEGQAK